MLGHFLSVCPDLVRIDRSIKCKHSKGPVQLTSPTFFALNMTGFGMDQFFLSDTKKFELFVNDLLMTYNG